MCHNSSDSSIHTDCATARKHGLFLAIDGVSGVVWNDLTSGQVAAALTAIERSSAADASGATPGSVEVVVPLTNDTLEVVDATAEGTVRVWVTSTEHAARPVLDAVLGTGSLAAALAARLVATLGLPNEAGSNAAA